MFSKINFLRKNTCNRKMPSTTRKCLTFKCQPFFLRKFRWILNLVRLRPRFHHPLNKKRSRWLRPHSDAFSDFPEILRSRNQGLIPTRNTFAVVACAFLLCLQYQKVIDRLCTFHEKHLPLFLYRAQNLPSLAYYIYEVVNVYKWRN